MRIVKEAEERKEEILDVAGRLFAMKGFENTSTNDILEGVGIARGTLYYHFKSKEEILNAVIKRVSDQMIFRLIQIVGDSSKSVMERLVEAIISLNAEPHLGSEVMAQVHKPQNALMHQKMNDEMLEKIIPVFTALIEEGVEEGIFRTAYPRNAVEMALIYSTEAFEERLIKKLSSQELKEKTEGYIYNLELLLGMETGSLSESFKMIFDVNMKTRR